MDQAEKIDTQGLSKQSETLTEKTEKLEKKLGITDKIKNVSIDVRTTYFKIKSIERKGIPQERLKNEYQKILDNFDKLDDTAIETQQDYFNATKELMHDLGELKTDDGKKVSEVMMDGGFYEMAEAVYEGVKRAGEKILEELKDNLKMLVSPEEWLEISKALGNAILHPVDFANNIISFVCDEYSHIARDLSILRQNTTKKGFAIEMGQFVPETCLPLVVSSIGQGKIGKFLKALKLGLPEKTLKAVEDIAKMKKIDILQMKFKFGEIGEKTQKYAKILNEGKTKGMGTLVEKGRGGLEKYLKSGNRQIELFNKFADVEYLRSGEHMDKFCRDLTNLSKFIEDNIDHIKGNKEICNQYAINMKELRNNLRKIGNGDISKFGKAKIDEVTIKYIEPVSNKILLD